MAFRIINIHDLLDVGGQANTQVLLSGFECPLNNEIEVFIIEKSIEFAIRKISVTYVVLNSLNEIAGFFTLAHKPSFVSINSLGSKTLERKLERFCGGLRIEDRFLASAFLIAPFGKNMKSLNGEVISGNELMNCAFEVRLRHLYLLRVHKYVLFLEKKKKS